MRGPTFRRVALAGAFAIACVALLTIPMRPTMQDAAVSTAVHEAVAGATVAQDSTGDDDTYATDDAAVGVTSQSITLTPATTSASDASAPDAVFALPDGVRCEPNTVLVQVNDDVSAAELTAALAETDGIIVGNITDADIAGGVVRLALAEGVSVAEGVNRIYAADVPVIGAQPNYAYTVSDLGTAADLRATLAADTPCVAGTVDAVASDAATDDTTTSDTTTDDTTTDSGLVSDEHDDPGTGVAAGSESVTVGVADSAADTGVVPSGGNVPAADTPTLSDALATSVSVNDPRAPGQWALSSIRAYEAWALARAGSPASGEAVTVAVLDTGFDITHADLRGNVVAAYNAHTRRSSAADLLAGAATSNRSHGTHVAGIVSAVADNGLGVAGVSHNARVMPIRTTDDAGTAYTSDLVEAYNYVIARRNTLNVRVVNLSMGAARIPFTSDDAFLRKIDEAYGAGIVTVAAAGNSNLATPPYDCYPGDYSTVVSVINLRQSGTGVVRDTSSNYNAAGETDKNVSAPGTSILSTVPGDDYTTMSGTSMAAPSVAGVLALEFAANPSLSAAEARQILFATALDVGDVGFDAQYGHGEVDAAAAVRAVWDDLREQEARAEEEAQRQVAAVRTLIDALPVVARLTLADKDALEAARAAYDALPVERRADVDATRLVADEVRIAELEEQQRLAAIVQAKIDALPVVARLTLADKDALEAARAAYDALPQEAQQAVDTTRLVADEARIAELERPIRPTVEPTVAYGAHVQNIGWQDVEHDGSIAGTIGKSLRLEGVKISVDSPSLAGSIQYRAYVQRTGWQSWKGNGELAGTSSQGLRLEALQIRLTGELARQFDVWYCVHAQHFGWMGWAKNGESAGTAAYGYRLEALRICLVRRDAAAPGADSYAFRSPVQYQTHVQNIGWQGVVADGATSGTSGQSLRLEAIKMSLPSACYSGSIQYRTHIQNLGWESVWRSDGAQSGTISRSLRLEAIQVRLTGKMADHYDVWYRVHAQNIGWMGWAKNGESAGTSGYSYRLEALQVCLVEKGGAAPGTIVSAYAAR